MFKKCLSLVLVLLLALGTFTACGKDKSTSADKNGASANEDTDSATKTEEELLTDVQNIAYTIAEATMTYDLTTIKKYSVLDSDTCEKMLSFMLPEIINEDGEYEWDGVYCGPEFDDFVRVYDEENAREYESITIKLTDSKLYNNTEILAAADTRELLYRDENSTATYSEAVEGLNIEKVAVYNYTVTFTDKTTEDPMTGEPEIHEEMTVTLAIYMALIDGEWKSYSPTIAGAFPPLTHFPRYTVEV